MIFSGKLDWTIQNKISVYGQDLTLICNVPDCCSKEAGWEAWTQKLRTIFIDIRDLSFTSNSKYTGDVYNFGYSLVIRNVSMEDVNIMYSCVYGDERSDKKMLIEKDIFLCKFNYVYIIQNELLSNKKCSIHLCTITNVHR